MARQFHSLISSIDISFSIGADRVTGIYSMAYGAFLVSEISGGVAVFRGNRGGVLRITGLCGGLADCHITFLDDFFVCKFYLTPNWCFSPFSQPSSRYAIIIVTCFLTPRPLEKSGTHISASHFSPKRRMLGDGPTELTGSFWGSGVSGLHVIIVTYYSETCD